MKYRVLLVSVFAALPVVGFAQETKLVNCRTLEAAGNFVGPDEVIDGDMVCQKVKAGDAASLKPQTLKPLPGAVISNVSPANVVDAAKASREIEKRAEAAREATAGKPAASEDTAAPEATPGAEPASGAPATVTPGGAAPVVPAPTVKKPEIVAPVKVPPMQFAVAPEATREPVAPPPVSATVEPTPAPAAAPISTPAPASVASVPAAPERSVAAPAERTNSAPPEVSLGPAPANAVATPVVAPVKDVTAEATPAPAAAVASSTEATGSPAAATPAPEKGSGFYDANVGNTVVTAAPAEPAKNSIVGAEPAGGPAEATPAAAVEPPATRAAAVAPPDDPNEERERIVRMGAFEKPREEGPDPTSLAHKTTFLPGDEDGFQEGQRPECKKNITLGSLKGEKLVLGTPGWAEKWIGKNQKHMLQVCFSETPMPGARNYLIVFYTSSGTAGPAELTNALLTSGQGTPASGVGTFTLSYGSTWHYSYDRTVGVTVLTRDDADEPHGQPGQELYATAYTEEGVPVAQHWPEKTKKQVKADPKSPKKIRAAREGEEQESSLLLSHLVEDIGRL